MPDSQETAATVRLDRWLWAARMFRTRSLAKQAVESGHVRYHGERCKVGRQIGVGARLTIRRGAEDLELVVLAVDDQRRAAALAQQLYRETPESLERRDRERLQRRLAHGLVSDSRPTRQQRRELLEFKRQR
jgi:ribosome-associated heat shock protein Hsp15